MRYFGATARSDRSKNLDRNSVKNAMAIFSDSQHFLLSATARNLSLTGHVVNAPYHSKRRVQAGKFDAGVFRAERPVGPGVMEIAVFFPRAGFADDDLLVGDAAVEALRREDAEFGLGHPSTSLSNH
jgi:hypothetical protein